MTAAAIFLYSLAFPLAAVSMAAVVWTLGMVRREKRRRWEHRWNVKRAILCG